ncbi:TapY2 family type IVa secretion system protein [Shewanella halotolerans]|uniref:TapY2 family type IVa secretion system protein n=1 Tax=Shewanella halotolerans TaxID=2864204 RepID=UPI001C656A36|nr:TapY2 family type IVa secretion system protein [Shewanella halotolerans]QYJ88913.1 TapY2 family type IVa secretion system protein [Shewanella halotolerans]
MNKLILLVLLAFSVIAGPLKAEPREDYKCFIETNEGQVLVRFSWQPSKAPQYKKQLVGSQLPALLHTDGKPMTVKRVYECAKKEEAFSTSQGRMLEHNWPMEG